MGTQDVIDLDCGIDGVETVGPRIIVDGSNNATGGAAAVAYS